MSTPETQNGKPRVAIIESQPVFRIGLATILTPVCRVLQIGVAPQTGIPSMLEKFNGKGFSLAFVGCLPGIHNSVQEQKQRKVDLITGLTDEMPVISFCNSLDRDFKDLLSGGRLGRGVTFLGRSCKESEILDAVAAILSTEPSEPEQDGKNPLSIRQREVLELIYQWKSNRDIAQVLGIKVGTAINHVHAALGKLSTCEEFRSGLKFRRWTAAQVAHNRGWI